MTLIKRKGAATLLALSSVIGAGLLDGTAQAAPAGESQPVGTAAYSDCPAGHICFWSGKNGTGSRCQWEGDDPDWWSGNIVCSWADEKPVASVFNNGRDTDFGGVVYYGPDGKRKGCTKRTVQGNLSGDYKVRSHEWVKSC